MANTDCKGASLHQRKEAQGIHVLNISARGNLFNNNSTIALFSGSFSDASKSIVELLSHLIKEELVLV